MIANRTISAVAVVALVLFLSSCGPKSKITDPELLIESSKGWIPYSGEEQIAFFHDTATMLFTGNGKETYFDHVLYMSDQSGFFTYQQDYYADLERQELFFHASSFDYFLHYFLKKGKGETGHWDQLYVQIGDGHHYQNQISIVIYESDDYNKGEMFKFKPSISLNGNEYTNVYYHTQEQRPFEVYYTKERGIVAFKVSATELWTVDPDNLKN